ncbi:RabGAP/TBC [Thelephora ganbajun]|uniref:RabGAP/TBC n=1 Tax=Thelephora ganbajun TaxID=370292 RepID=A0ACB6Z716_THEGA|nr:RabGAP/TBC [Thelephora ganbajun]
MDFELVKPSFPRTLSPRSSLESFASQQHDNDHQASPIRQGGANFLRTESPSSFLSSGVSEKDGAALNRKPSPSSIAQSDVLSPSDIDAHRNRELKWVLLMSTLDPTQARKSKKVKKLLLDGVPASVRYQVWAHLADCKGKRMNGLYPQLVKRGAVPATPAIIRDGADRFGDQPQGKDGSIVSVLQAYLTMVPDVQYHIALTCIVGQLLAQSPEEDAFWIFISMMDSYLRPYFSSSVVQLDFDATLFANALETNDAPLAKRIFVDMSIPPLTICRQWFCSLFYDTIPAEYHLRVWDVFLFEGVPFLFRVGLALFACCRRPLLEAQSRDRALSILSQVPLQCLPPNGDTLIELAISKKLKDDDVRKARNKVETKKKRTISTRLLKSSTNPGTPISLPRG